MRRLIDKLNKVRNFKTRRTMNNKVKDIWQQRREWVKKMEMKEKGLNSGKEKMKATYNNLG
ncbi:hypothetical protein [Flexithrix dorotheae]|uniref:hypothetical protein n=1 Tax=Flexithrix dorotheae TaxID=70993 RepID=UPI000369D477|nr:hypothetical protein [Flexithrix dorotheae]